MIKIIGSKIEEGQKVYVKKAVCDKANCQNRPEQRYSRGMYAGDYCSQHWESSPYTEKES